MGVRHDSFEPLLFYSGRSTWMICDPGRMGGTRSHQSEKGSKSRGGEKGSPPDPKRCDQVRAFAHRALLTRRRGLQVITSYIQENEALREPIPLRPGSRLIIFAAVWVAEKRLDDILVHTRTHCTVISRAWVIAVEIVACLIAVEWSQREPPAARKLGAHSQGDSDRRRLPLDAYIRIPFRNKIKMRPPSARALSTVYLLVNSRAELGRGRYY